MSLTIAQKKELKIVSIITAVVLAAGLLFSSIGDAEARSYGGRSSFSSSKSFSFSKPKPVAMKKMEAPKPKAPVVQQQPKPQVVHKTVVHKTTVVQRPTYVGGTPQGGAGSGAGSGAAGSFVSGALGAAAGAAVTNMLMNDNDPVQQVQDQVQQAIPALPSWEDHVKTLQCDPALFVCPPQVEAQ